MSAERSVPPWSANQELETLCGIVKEIGPSVVAYSGGIDSSVVLAVAVCELERVLAVTGLSPSLPQDEIKHIEDFCSRIGVMHRFLATTEFADDRYLSNSSQRCYFCKGNLYAKLCELAEVLEYRHVLDGTHSEDDFERRPGMRAALEYGVLSPLKLAGFNKDMVRRAALDLGISFWDKPSSPCLSSRVPTGIRITPEILRQIDSSERALHQIGFADCRVRYNGDMAMIELSEEDMERAVEPRIRRNITSSLSRLGFGRISLSLFPRSAR